MEVNVSLDVIRTSSMLSDEDLMKVNILLIKYYFEKYKQYVYYNSCNGVLGRIVKAYFSRYAKRNIERVKDGRSIIVIKYRGDVPVGFMIGDIEGWKEARLSSYYVDDENHLEAKNSTLAMFRVLLRELKNRSVQTVVASCSYSENKFIDALEMLGFEPIKEDDSTMKYGYRIKPL